MDNKMTAEQALHCLMARLAQFDYDSGLIDLSEDLPRLHEPEELEWRDVILSSLSAPRVPVGFCEDTALSLAERTFSSEVDEHLAEDVIQYARRLHDLYASPEPVAPDQQVIADLRARIDAMPADWSHDSSLETWFPYTAQELADLRAEVEALKAAAAEAETRARIKEVSTIREWATQQGTSVISERFRTYLIELMESRRKVLLKSLREGGGE